MKRLKIVNDSSEFNVLYSEGVPSNDIVLIKDTGSVIMSTNNATGEYAEYSGSGTLDPSVIDELGLVTVDMIEDLITLNDVSNKLEINDISTKLEADDVSVFAKLNAANAGNLIIGGSNDTTGYSIRVVKKFNGHESLSGFGNGDNRTNISNKVNGVDNAKLTIDHEKLTFSYSGDISTNYSAGYQKHVAFIEDTSENFATKNEVSTFCTLSQVQGEGYLKSNDVSNLALKSELEGFVDANDISAFLTSNDISNLGGGGVSADDISLFITESDLETYLSTNGYVLDDGLTDPVIRESYMSDHDAMMQQNFDETYMTYAGFDSSVSNYVSNYMANSDVAYSSDLDNYLPIADASRDFMTKDASLFWVGDASAYALLSNHTDYKLYLIIES